MLALYCRRGSTFRILSVCWEQMLSGFSVCSLDVYRRPREVPLPAGKVEIVLTWIREGYVLIQKLAFSYASTLSVFLKHCEIYLHSKIDLAEETV